MSTPLSSRDDALAWVSAHAASLNDSAADADLVIPRLGAAGFFRIGVPAAQGGSAGTTADAIEAIAAVAERSLTAAFVFWGQRTFIEYLLHSPNAALRERHLPALLAGELAGATGLSNAMKFLSGINRLSIGIQSFQDSKLKALGRIHDGGEAVRAADMARAAGFDNFNLDLMHGLPEQTLEEALADLHLAIAQQPSHLSWYQLTMEPNTQFWSQPPSLPEDDILWDIQEAGQALLAEQGYAQYETSAYARPQRQARHNLNYWTFGDFIGIGAGAHGKLSHADGRIQRTWKTRLP